MDDKSRQDRASVHCQCHILDYHSDIKMADRMSDVVVVEQEQCRMLW